MKRFAFAVILVLGLFSTSIPTVHAATKAGAKCKAQGITSTIKNYKYTCNKVGGKLIWSKGQRVLTTTPTPTIEIPPLTFENIESSKDEIVLGAWAKSHFLWTKTERKIQGVQLLFGPTLKPLNCYGGITEITKISNFWKKYKQPEKSLIIYAANEDSKWATNEFIKNTGNSGPVNRGAGVASVDPQGIGQIVFYVSGFETPSGCGGGIEKHEYTHLVQLSQRSQLGQLIKNAPPSWYLEGQAEFAGSSEFPLEYYKKISSIQRFLPQNTLKDSEPSTISNFLKGASVLSAANYVIGYQVIEILTAIGGPYSTMDVIVEMANGKSFSEGFESVYKLSWDKAVEVISNIISVQIKENQIKPLVEFKKIKEEIGKFKWPERGYFDEALFN